MAPAFWTGNRLDGRENGGQLLHPGGHGTDAFGGLNGLLVAPQITIMVDDEIALFGNVRDGQPSGGSPSQFRGFGFQGEAEGCGLEDLTQEFCLLGAGEGSIVHHHHGLDAPGLDLAEEFFEGSETEAPIHEATAIQNAIGAGLILGQEDRDSPVTAAKTEVWGGCQLTQSLGGIAAEGALADDGHRTGGLQGLADGIQRGGRALQRRYRLLALAVVPTVANSALHH